MPKLFDPRFEAYAHFGGPGQSMLTKRVDLRLRPSRNGHYQALVAGRWRRVTASAVTVDGSPVRIQIVRNEA